MDLIFINPGFDYMIDRIMAFQTEESTAFWSEPLFHFFPQLDREYAESLNFFERQEYIKRILGEVYREQKSVIDGKAARYKEHWDRCREQITSALSDAFELDCGTLFNDLRCNVSMNPIEPRFLRERSFDIFYLNSERGAVGEAIHEIIHFVWFYVWNRLFGDSYDEYESPSLKWIFSEMVIESVMRDPRLSSINPYFPRENGGCIYPYFFNMKAGGVLVLDTIDEMYRSCGILDFMKKGYDFCAEHETAIREHIALYESGGMIGI